MHTSANRWIVLVGAGMLLAADPAAPPRPAVPPALAAEPGPQLGEPTLPTPRPLPTGPPVEEPAPAPRELSVPPGGGFPLQPNVAPPGLSREEAAPMPREQTPAPPQLFLPGLLQPAPLGEVRTLHNEIEGLRMECEAMLHEETELRTALDLKGGKDDDPAQLRRRIAELLAKVAQQNKKQQAAPAGPSTTPPDKSTAPAHPRADQAKTSPSASASDGPPHPLVLPKQPTPATHPAKQTDHAEHLLTEAPVDPRSLAMTLFLAGEHEDALKAYRKLEQEEQKVEDRITVQYMIACCLRKLGKLEEAAVLYREVANSGGEEILVENAQWYLRAMKERRELETQLDELRQRRQTVMPRKP